MAAVARAAASAADAADALAAVASNPQSACISTLHSAALFSFLGELVLRHFARMLAVFHTAAASPALCFVLAAIGSLANRTQDLSEAVRALQVLARDNSLPSRSSCRHSLCSQSRGARCCSSLAAALKAASTDKARWSLADGEWGEFIASVAVIDHDAVHEVRPFCLFDISRRRSSHTAQVASTAQSSIKAIDNMHDMLQARFVFALFVLILTLLAATGRCYRSAQVLKRLPRLILRSAHVL